MIFNERIFTDIALGFVKEEQVYDPEIVGMNVASEITSRIQRDTHWSMSPADAENFRNIMRNVARNVINWKRLDKKVHPREWADSVEYEAWPKPIGGEL